MTMSDLHFRPSTEKQMTELAAVLGVTVEQFVTDAVEAKLSQLTQLTRLQQASSVSREQFLAALAASPDVPPLPGDDFSSGKPIELKVK